MGYSTKVVQDRRIQMRRGHSAEWTQKDPILLEGEIGFEVDTNKIKIGNGKNSWSNLEYLTGVGGGGAANIVTDYRSSIETDGYIYSGYIINDIPTIKKVIDNTEEFAQNVTNLETDWINRLTLIYV